VTAALKLWAVALLVLPDLALAGPKKLTILFTGDNGGEIAPCG
jgi:hypothetical protein